jgi:peptidoglycan/LPS O-acetylase OafA/YrhL
MRLDSLDLVRGLAALLVLVGHLRAYIFQSYGEVAQMGVALKAFYFVTGLGNEAVIIFFALSGFLVGGKALQDLLQRRFSWSRYLLRRLTRLWIVIVPALALTMLFDSIGSTLTHDVGYDGRFYDMYTVGPDATGISHSWPTFLGNLAFLQNIYVPAFGSDGPIWSLANEFWYYIVFPLAAWLVLGLATPLARIGGLLLLTFLSVTLPTSMLAAGVIWVAGAAAAWCANRPSFSRFLNWTPARLGAISLFILAVILSRLQFAWFDHIKLGLVVAATLPIIAALPSPGGIYGTIARASSEFSFTLYLTHFPLLTLIVLAGFAPTRFTPSIIAFAIFAGLASIAVGWAASCWWVFERNTDRIFASLASRLPIPALATPNRRSVFTAVEQSTPAKIPNAASKGVIS